MVSALDVFIHFSPCLTFHSPTARSPARNPESRCSRLSARSRCPTCSKFQAYFRQLTPPVLIVDLSQVTYMDSAGLGLLMNGYVSAEGRKNKFLLAAVNERVNALLQLTRVDTVLHIFPSVDAAEVGA